MRYTTIIDITEYRDVYRNVNARLLYMHLALRAGWHDEDRDKVKISIRNVAMEAGLTVSATRHAIALLEKNKLLTRSEDGVWTVLKWHVDKPPTPRQKKVTAQTAETNSLADKMESQLQEYRTKVMQAIRASTKEELQAWLTELKEHRSLRHHGVSINANEANITWLENIIKKLN